MCTIERNEHHAHDNKQLSSEVPKQKERKQDSSPPCPTNKHLQTNEICEDSERIGGSIRKANPETKEQTQSYSCDNLILSDSILRRIRPQKFSPNEKILTRYIRGGSKTCESFIKTNGSRFQPKRVLVHIGARDLQKDGINETDFKEMFQNICSTWSNAEIYILTIMQTLKYSLQEETTPTLNC